MSPVRQETSNDQAKMQRYEKLAKYLKAKEEPPLSLDQMLQDTLRKANRGGVAQTNIAIN